MKDLATVWGEVSNWPPEQRQTLATRLLESLRDEQQSVAVSKARQEALQQLIGIWKSDQPPNDEEVERMVNQARIKKYG